mmetsp:Transcript_78695/g.204421  ORF Transcript_78695/g.204421 Transcript_78695/m.204421 type:complete len:242 (-) Transcript_78695:407-1132(-)
MARAASPAHHHWVTVAVPLQELRPLRASMAAPRCCHTALRRHHRVPVEQHTGQGGRPMGQVPLGRPVPAAPWAQGQQPPMAPVLVPAGMPAGMPADMLVGMPAGTASELDQKPPEVLGSGAMVLERPWGSHPELRHEPREAALVQGPPLQGANMAVVLPTLHCRWWQLRWHPRWQQQDASSAGLLTVHAALVPTPFEEPPQLLCALPGCLQSPHHRPVLPPKPTLNQDLSRLERRRPEPSP